MAKQKQPDHKKTLEEKVKDGDITNPKIQAQIGVPVKDERTRDESAQPETSDLAGPYPNTNQENPEAHQQRTEESQGK